MCAELINIVMKRNLLFYYEIIVIIIIKRLIIATSGFPSWKRLRLVVGAMLAATRRDDASRRILVVAL